MNLDGLKKRLRGYQKKDIIITNHAKMQAIFREVRLDEIKNNILNPDKLVYAEKQKAINPNEEKYACYFAYSKDFCHEYVFTINGKIIIVTIIVINRNWQKIIERK